MQSMVRTALERGSFWTAGSLLLLRKSAKRCIPEDGGKSSKGGTPISLSLTASRRKWEYPRRKMMKRIAATKAQRNKTINTPLHKGQMYLDRCIAVDRAPSDIHDLADRTILGSMFDICPLLPENSVDLIVADPPYNLTKSFNGAVFSKKSQEDYEQYTRQWLSIVKPLLKDSGSIYVCCDWETSLVIGRVLQDFFKVRSRITWQREKGRGSKRNWKNSLEDIFFATKSDQYVFNVDAVKVRRKVMAPYRVNGNPKDWVEGEGDNYRDTCPSNFWDDITVPFWSMPENTAHPTQKSEKLVAKLILASSQKNNIVLDPFLGSGTTSVVAKKLGRRYIGIEIDPQYCVWAEQRLETAESSPRIQGYVDGVFWERNSLNAQNTLLRTSDARRRGQSFASSSDTEANCNVQDSSTDTRPKEHV